MLLTLFLTCAIGLTLATILLLAAGRRVRLAFRPLGLLLSAVIALAAGKLAMLAWDVPTSSAIAGAAILFASGLVVVGARPQWNAIGQAFFGAFVAAALVYLAFGLYVTFGTGLSSVATVASFVLFVFELLALFLAASFTFESLDVICRGRWDRPIPDPDPGYRPFVSLQVAAFNEPPDMLIQTIQSL